MSLSDLEPGQSATIERINVEQSGHSLAYRLEAMGLMANKPVHVLRKAAFGGPLHIRVGSTTELAIRPQEAAYVLVKC